MKLIRLALALALAMGGVGLALPAHAATDTWRAHLSGANEIPANDSQAQGQAVFRLSADSTAITYRLQVANIDNVIAAHIHVGGPEVNGPVVVQLFGNAPPGGGRVSGTLAQGTITAADLLGSLAGQPLGELVEHIESGNTYVNVHTNDGVDPINTGPGDLPGGEIRGQIF